MDIDAASEGTTLSVGGAARMLGVHANTVRAWTDQGRLPCIRINDRGDRRYRDRDLRAFLAHAGLHTTPALPFQSRIRPPARERLGPGEETVPAASASAGVPARPSGPVPAAPPPDATAQVWTVAMLGRLAATHARTGDLDATLRSAIRHLRDTGRFAMLTVARWQGERLVPRLTEGSLRARAWWRDIDPALARVCCVEQRSIATSALHAPDGRRGTSDGTGVQVFTPIGHGPEAWGVLISEARAGVAVDPAHLDLLSAVGGVLALVVEQSRLSRTLEAQADAAMRHARDLERTATWAAQLQSIQALGARLARLATVSEIGQTICLELRQLIDYHNVRVYRVVGDEVVPIAWRGEVGEYTGEIAEQLRLTVGHGITGWVAEHGVSQYLPDASADPRSETIPGTEDDLEESMLLAPLRYEDRTIGVLVLSKLGLDRFVEDELRYLEIYASMAAQAIVNADAAEQLRAQSERLERQLETQRELIRITESILSSLDPRTVVAEIADRLGTLVPVDTLGLDLYEAATGLLVPMYARGVDADRYLGRTLSDRQGVAGWVVRHGEAQLVQDELADARVAHFDEGPQAGALIVAPLQGRDGVAGVLTLERLGSGARFEAWEFELVTLFAGHVSIALANAVAHQAVERRAMTDALTGLKNQGTFADDLARAVARNTPFGLLIIDLDDFKSYNDRDGHEAGNRLLRTIAREIGASVRTSDDVYRYGGDEFAIILPHTGDAGALEVARKVGRAVADIDQGRVTCSIGVAAFPADGADRDGILLAADRACYAAKRAGRGRIATAEEGQGLPAELHIPPPTPVDDPGVPEPGD